jgi:hypothetical protein
MSPDAIAVGVFTIVGAVSGALAGLLGERWVRSRGNVQCMILAWTENEGNNAGPSVRGLEVRFVNEKELPVMVLDMRVEFYKGRKPLEEWARPSLQFVDQAGFKSPLSPVNVPLRSAVALQFIVAAGRDDIQRELAQTDRGEFVAKIVGAGEKRAELPSPWWG